MTQSGDSDSSYPRTETTRYGFDVDAGIVTHIERVIDTGLTPRASCSGLDRDHTPERNASPYISIQVAPTFETARPTTTLLDEHLDSPLLKRFQRVGERAGWTVGDGITWMLYPTVTFRLSPSRGDMKNQMFGRAQTFDSLSADEEARLDQRYDTVGEAVSRFSDDELRTRWDDLLDELAHEFNDEDPPQFNDRREEFEAAQEDWPEVFEVFFDSDAELLKFYR